MDVCTVIKMRLQELGLEQKDLAAADPEEATAGTGPDGYLREDGQIPAPIERRAGNAGSSATDGRAQT